MRIDLGKVASPLSPFHVYDNCSNVCSKLVTSLRKLAFCWQRELFSFSKKKMLNRLKFLTGGASRDNKDNYSSLPAPTSTNVNIRKGDTAVPVFQPKSNTKANIFQQFSKDDPSSSPV